MTTYDELLAAAARVLPAEVYAYIVAGGGQGLVAREAADSWSEHRWAPRVLRDVSQADASTALLGQTYRSPAGIAPTTLQRAVHPEGEIAMARAAVALDAPLVVSSNAGSTFADIGATGVRWWLQAYVTADRALMAPMLAKAVAAGAGAVVLTVDTAVVARKAGPAADVWDTVDEGVLGANFHDDPAAHADKVLDLTPADIGWLAQTTGLPVVVKGITHPEDAQTALSAGAAAVWVSNHGGRQFDRSVSTAAALPVVRAAVGPEAEVYVDGGVRHGLDILAAHRMGATAVFCGRAPLLALLGGYDGVMTWGASLRDEVLEGLRLAGVLALSDLTNPL